MEPKKDEALLRLLGGNNFLLIRFLAPVYPGALELEASVIASIAPIRDALQWLEGLAFCGLNFWYLAALIKERRPRRFDL